MNRELPVLTNGPNHLISIKEENEKLNNYLDGHAFCRSVLMDTSIDILTYAQLKTEEVHIKDEVLEDELRVDGFEEFCKQNYRNQNEQVSSYEESKNPHESIINFEELNSKKISETPNLRIKKENSDGNVEPPARPPVSEENVLPCNLKQELEKKSRKTSMSSKAEKINNTNCSVIGCHSRKGRERDVHFHYYPKKNSGIKVKIQNAFGQEENIDVRKAWEKVLLMGKPVTKSMRVCSKHFTPEDYLAHGVQLKRPKLKKYAVPSKCLSKKKQYGEKSNIKPGTSRGSSVRTERINRLKVSSSISEMPICDKVVPEVFRYDSMEQRQLSELTEEEKVVVQNLLALNSVDCKFVDKEVQVKSGVFCIYSYKRLTPKLFDRD